MTFPAYPDYRDSGVEWLGAVPTYWESWKISHAFGELGSGTTPPTSETEWYENGTVPWVTTGELRETVVWETKKLLSSTALSAFSALRLHPAGSLAIAMYGATIGRLGILGVDATTNQACCLLTRPNHLHVKFTFYWLLVFKQSIIDLYASGGGQPNINQEIIANLKVPAPEVGEQAQIARFLNHETARIDALIEEQQRLIELLKEKRQAVISHAVTKGIDLTVPLKDSGVEWLGKVPVHWVVRKLKNLVSVRGGSTPSKEVEHYWTGDIPWVSPKDMKSERINNSIDHISESAIEDGGLNMVKSGAILIVVRGMILIHSVPVAITDVDVTINQDIKAMTPSAELSSVYLSLMLQGVRDAVFQYIDSSAHGTRKLEWERFELIELPIPPHAEQLKVISFIETQKRAIDDLAKQAASAITLIKERRSALISAAVTGKIDVRGWQPPATATSPELAQEAV